MLRLNVYAGLIDSMFSETTATITANTIEIAQVRKLVLHEKLALDYILAEQRGMCQVIQQEDCCTWVNDNEDIVKGHIRKIKELQHKAREIGHEGWKPLKGLQIGDLFASIESFFRQIGTVLFLAIICTFVSYLVDRIIMCIIRHQSSIHGSNTPSQQVYRVRMVEDIYDETGI